MMTGDPASSFRVFSIVKVGPFWRLLQLKVLGGGRLVRAGIMLGLFSWLPLLLLSAFDGVLLSGPAIPFYGSLGTHTRLLVTIPLMFAAEVWFDDLSGAVIRELVRAGIVRPSSVPSFADSLRRTTAMMGSPIVEITLVVLAGLLLFFGGRVDLPNAVSTWRGPAGDTTWAGWWYITVSMPLFQFLLWRWCWRLLVWAAILWHIARLDLFVVPTHPDLAGGLGGLGLTQCTLTPLLFGLSAMMVASFAEDVLFAQVSLDSLALPLTSVVVGGVLMVLAPLLFFAPKLLRIKERGLLDYGALGSEYTQAFAARWVRRGTLDDQLLGTADIQSLADLANSFGVIRDMRVVPCSWRQVLMLALACILPMAPLVLIVLPLNELIIRGVRTTLGL